MENTSSTGSPSTSAATHPAASALRYGSGFGNELASEAIAGALPAHNSPQRVPFGLYAEQLSGTAFTVPRHESRRSWLYRIRPSALHPKFSRMDHGGLCGPLAAPTPESLTLGSPAPPCGRRRTSSMGY